MSWVVPTHYPKPSDRTFLRTDLKNVSHFAEEKNKSLEDIWVQMLFSSGCQQVSPGIIFRGMRRSSKQTVLMQETRVQSLGQEDASGEGNGNPLQYSCLGNPMGRGAWCTTVHGVTKSQTWLSD